MGRGHQATRDFAADNVLGPMRFDYHIEWRTNTEGILGDDYVAVRWAEVRPSLAGRLDGGKGGVVLFSSIVTCSAPTAPRIRRPALATSIDSSRA